MKIQISDARQIRNEAKAAIAVVTEDVERAEGLLAKIKKGEVDEATLFVAANDDNDNNKPSQFKTYAALDEVGLGGLVDFETVCESEGVRYSLALAVPTKELQSEPTIKDGVAQRIFCSTNGFCFRTQQERLGGANENRYKYRFTRPSFWLVRLVVDAQGKPVFYATLLGQYRNSDGQFEYRPMVRKSFDIETSEEVEKPITKVAKSLEEAKEELHSNAKFLFAMVKSVSSLAESQRRRNGLLASVNRAPVEHLTTSIGELFPGLANTKVAKPKKASKKASQKTDQTELVAAE